MTVIYGNPTPVGTITTTSYIPGNSASYVSTYTASGTKSGSVVYGVPVGTVTTTTYLPGNSASYVTTYKASGPQSGSVVYGVPVGTVTTTTYLPGNSASYVSTYTASGSKSGSVIYGVPVGTVTTTTYLPGNSASYVSTYTASGSKSGSVVYGVPVGKSDNILLPSIDFGGCLNTQPVQFRVICEPVELTVYLQQEPSQRPLMSLALDTHPQSQLRAVCLGPWLRVSCSQQKLFQRSGLLEPRRQLLRKKAPLLEQSVLFTLHQPQVVSPPSMIALQGTRSDFHRLETGSNGGI